jgi:hypothetical protein
MKTQPTANAKLYIGMDIHKKSWTVHMRTDLSDHKTMTIPSIVTCCTGMFGPISPTQRFL